MKVKKLFHVFAVLAMLPMFVFAQTNITPIIAYLLSDDDDDVPKSEMYVARYTEPGTYTFTFPTVNGQSVTFDVFATATGGGGGAGGGGDWTQGRGSKGMTFTGNFKFKSGEQLTIEVGAGGKGGGDADVPGKRGGRTRFLDSDTIGLFGFGGGGGASLSHDGESSYNLGDEGPYTIVAGGIAPFGDSQYTVSPTPGTIVGFGWGARQGGDGEDGNLYLVMSVRK